MKVLCHGRISNIVCGLQLEWQGSLQKKNTDLKTKSKSCKKRPKDTHRWQRFSQWTVQTAACPSRVLPFRRPGSLWCSCYSMFYFLCSVFSIIICLFPPFVLAILLSVMLLRLTKSLKIRKVQTKAVNWRQNITPKTNDWTTLKTHFGIFKQL